MAFKIISCTPYVRMHTCPKLTRLHRCSPLSLFVPRSSLDSVTEPEPRQTQQVSWPSGYGIGPQGQGRQAQDLPGSCLAAGTQAGSQHVAMDGCVTWHDPGGTSRRTGCQSGMDPRMGVKPGVGMHQIGMRNAPQAGMAGICLGHEHVGQR